MLSTSLKGELSSIGKHSEKSLDTDSDKVNRKVVVKDLSFDLDLCLREDLTFCK